MPANPDVIVSPEWVRAHLDDPGTVFVHIGSHPDEYAAGHLPGARWAHGYDDLTVTRDGVRALAPSHSSSVGLGVVASGLMSRLVCKEAVFGISFKTRSIFRISFRTHSDSFVATCAVYIQHRKKLPGSWRKMV